MTVYVEYELRCDGVEGDPFACDVIFDLTEDMARTEAARHGWAVGVELPGQTTRRDFCPIHRKDLYR